MEAASALGPEQTLTGPTTTTTPAAIALRLLRGRTARRCTQRRVGPRCSPSSLSLRLCRFWVTLSTWLRRIIAAAFCHTGTGVGTESPASNLSPNPPFPTSSNLLICVGKFSGVPVVSDRLHAPSHRSAASLRSNNSRGSTPRNNTQQGMMNSDRSRSRRERTFVGSECAVCEEPLEHTLRGERILQFSCTHVAHEACFYEFIREFDSQYCPTCNAPLHLDTSRGGNVLDIGKEETAPRARVMLTR